MIDAWARAGCLAAALAAPLGAALAQDWRIDPAQSRIGFGYVLNDDPREGRFQRFGGAIQFDPAAPETSAAQIAVEAASLTLGDAMAEGILMTAPWFDAESHPKASFTLSGLRKQDDGFMAEGVLTIKDIAKPIRAPLTLTLSDDAARAQGAFSFARRDFKLQDGLTESFVTIGETIAITFDIVAHPG